MIGHYRDTADAPKTICLREGENILGTRATTTIKVGTTFLPVHHAAVTGTREITITLADALVIIRNTGKHKILVDHNGTTTLEPGRKVILERQTLTIHIDTFKLTLSQRPIPRRERSGSLEPAWKRS